MENETTELWRDHANDMKIMRDRRRLQFDKAVRSLKRAGFEVKRMSEYQYRINDCLDIYPSNKRFHDLRTKERGDIRGIGFGSFVRQRFGITNY